MAIRKKKKKKQDEVLVDLVEARESASDFVERNQIKLFGGLAAIVILIGGYLAYKNLYVAENQKEAVEQMAQAQYQFERDSFALALTNPGATFPGFLDVIDQYGGTPAGNLASYYAGVSYLNLGNFNDAISYLKDYSADGKVMPIMKNGALGDAYAENGDLGSALSYYQKAAGGEANEALTPYYLKKIGMLQEKNGDLSAALSTYNKIKSDFATSNEAKDIDKYIVRAQAKG